MVRFSSRGAKLQKPLASLMCRFRDITIFTARRYASAVFAVAVCLSVRLSRRKSELYENG